MMDMSPHQFMAALDKEGTAYWINSIHMNGHQILGRCDVIGHTEDWLHVKIGERTRFLPMQHISFDIEEG